MKKHAYKTQTEYWFERWSNIGKINHRHHHHSSQSIDSKDINPVHTGGAIDKEFRESLAYFH